ncbi:tetratricopeptide (TPR) repeat protein [Amycolatopsis lexingtonensis]|uniref:Tetratricopeptide (TPR) repeat protein n=1 Tax=Amycolatopsis lexingtonensis TaxID=218822 RepID=A0ABR9HS45_9PSEU|nr:tetratricopeptide repeat protein [Amycolatopsis lexingtonensis]MBE1493582.1 tetratricopeptide (TPR) repeat protein [Amycolatopsis lexingtonensis]
MAKYARPAILAVGAAVAVALPATLAVAKVDTPVILAVSSAAAAILAIFADHWRSSLLEVLKRGHTQDLAMRNGCLRISGRKLPTVRQVTDPTVLGVHPSRKLRGGTNPANAQPVYVPRDIDSELRELLATPGFVLISGDSTAGKTRTAYESISAELRNHTLVAVQDKKALESAVSKMETMRNAVLFLDNLERFLGDDGFTSNAVYRLTGDATCGRFIVGTIRSSELTKYDSTDHGSRTVTHEILDTLALADRIDLPRMFSDAEQDRARTRVQRDERIADALKHAETFGIGEYLAAGPELMKRWKAARDGGENMRGAALVAAAVDCRRAGLTGPLPRALITRLAEEYLPVRGGKRVAGEPVNEAWLWAVAEGQTTALLIPDGAPGDDMVEVFDYLVDETTRAATRPVSDSVLRACLDNADTAEIMRVGITARLHARYQIALDAFDKARGTRAGTHGSSSESALAAWGHYAAMLRIMGRLNEAEQEHRAVLAARLDALGPDNPGTLASRNNLALVLHDLGRLDDAAAQHRIVHEVRARTLGSDHPATLTNRNNLAMVLHDLGLYEEAESEHCWVLRAYERRLRMATAEASRGVTNTAAVLVALGRVEDAEAEHRTVLDTSTRIFGPDHPDALTSKGSPTLVLHAPDRLAEAEELHTAVFEGFSCVLGPDNPTTLTALSNLAVVQNALGHFKEAEKAHRETVEGFAKVLGKDHPTTLTCRSNHAVALHALGLDEQAEEEHRQVVAGFTRTFDGDHPSTLTSRNYLASLLFELGRIDEARIEQELVVDGFSRILGSDHPSTLTSRGNLAVSLYSLNHLTKAKVEQEAVVTGFTRLRGPDHPSTLTSRSNLAVVLRALGLVDEAVRESQSVLEGFVRLLGKGHPRTVRARAILNSVRGGG